MVASVQFYLGWRRRRVRDAELYFRAKEKFHVLDAELAKVQGEEIQVLLKVIKIVLGRADALEGNARRQALAILVAPGSQGRSLLDQLLSQLKMQKARDVASGSA